MTGRPPGTRYFSVHEVEDSRRWCEEEDAGDMFRYGGTGQAEDRGVETEHASAHISLGEARSSVTPKRLCFLEYSPDIRSGTGLSTDTRVIGVHD